MMGSAVDIVIELYEALSNEERCDVIKKILTGATVSTYMAAGENPLPKGWGDAVPVHVKAADKIPKRSWKKPPFWTKTVDTVDKFSGNASGVAGTWGFKPEQTAPVLFGFTKPRHKYAVLKPTPGAAAMVQDDDGFEVMVPGAELVIASKEWEPVREKLIEMLVGF